ncbi:hypothetical protein [Carboxylicivirga linearis]|uniref:YcxB-like protein domain-containing protein n=1 Tax=Carboxylicivirga linearis TaxID=1628157 RepID=A0ABS5K275_9BACT|nr:hypothetical protein [Carboxylicivirga linearis]MBS2101228.1 hypothetical protein [Carboxylicivirga linearis]
MTRTVISDEIEILTDKEKEQKTIIAQKKHSSGSDKFAIFFLSCGIIVYPIAFFSVDKDFSFIVFSLIFILMIGGLGIQIFLAFKEKQIIEIYKDYFVFYKRRPFLSRKVKIEKKEKKNIELSKVRDLGFNYFIGIKYIVNLYSFKVPTINGFTFFEHFDEKQKKWIINYLKKK